VFINVQAHSTIANY